jgi:hypothetical protein
MSLGTARATAEPAHRGYGEAIPGGWRHRFFLEWLFERYRRSLD